MRVSGDEPQQPVARPSLFLERQSYRRRRLTDAARLLPFFGAVLLALPLLWPDDSGGTGSVPLSAAIIYIFACWGLFILIGIGFGFAAKRLTARDSAGAETDKWQP
jgi:hypothetical protein